MGDLRFASGCKIAGKYTLVRQLASGGMSDIWLAENDATGAEVALKVARGCDDGKDESSVLRERFRNEARACAKLAHRNIVRVFDLIEDGSGSLLLVMERLHGCTLTELLTVHGKLQPAPVVAVACAILAGLEHAHRAGVIHRDIKPDNVFLAREPDGVVTPKLLDLGVAKFSMSKLNLTADGLILGTPQYMSPEQIRAQKLDVRSDVFSVGVLLYEALSGTSPFEAPSTAAELAAVLERVPPRIEFIPTALWELIERALEKTPDRRPASAAALAVALRQAVGLTDAELAAAVESLVPAQVPDPRESLVSIESIRVVLRPPGSAMHPPAALASQETLSGETISRVSPRTTPLRRGMVYSLAALPFVATGLFLATFAAHGAPKVDRVTVPPVVRPASALAAVSVVSSAQAPESMSAAVGSATAEKRAVAPPPTATPRRPRNRVALTPGF